MKNIKIAIVGAGPSGLVTARRLKEHGYKYDVLEQAKTLGGAWAYTDRIGTDDNGLRTTCMYKDLITNVPKQLMACPGFPFSENKIKSYINEVEVLEYYNSFADFFNLKEYIKYNTQVIRITPFSDKWTVITKNLMNKNRIQSETYNYVYICNGRFSFPFVPEICGDHLFRGTKMHSCDFRKPGKCFENKRVLIIGGKTSGQDLAFRILEIAELVYLSTRESEYVDRHEKLIIKPEVSQITENGAIFDDDSSELVDVILYCTGYLYNCPFINDECGVRVEYNGVIPLYKHIMNIQHPTMYFISLLYPITGSLCDLQVRFCIALMEKKFQLPSKTDCLKEFEEFLRNKEKNNIAHKHIYKMSTTAESKEYCQELSKTANIPSVPIVLFNLFDKILSESSKQLCYKIIDDENFIEIDGDIV
ncbi:hypothetical protein FQR65_LT04448 [Abscondita terminalis]|nr:hypothetical protein FQR65_LT04448 [Abscondita terminalis]